MTSFVKFCYVYGNFKKSIKVAHLQKLANQAMMNGALVIEMTKWLFDEARNVLIEKNTRFRYISKLFRVCKRTGKLIMFRSDSSKYETCSKSFSRTLYGSKFLVSEWIFKLWKLERIVRIAVWKFFTTIIFYYVGQTPLDVQWRNIEKRNDKEHHEKASFFHLTGF